MKKIFTLFAALVCVMSMSAVTYNVTVPAGTNVCYIAGDMNSWSFTEMTKVDDTHYTLDIADATETMGYKYCSGPGWAYVEKTEGGEEIGNRVYAVKDVVAKWASVYDPGNAPTPGEAKDITVKAKMPTTWNDVITAWVWPTGGEGKEVTPTKEGDWYVYTEHCTELNIIFKNGAGWNGDINQTVDITISESTCVEITAGTGKATYTKVDCEENPGDNPGDDPVVDPETGVTYNVTVPVGTKACYIAGDMNSWSFTEMTKTDDTHYTVTLAEATDTMGYKYCSGPGWAYVELTEEGGEVANRTYAANDVVEAWKAVYDPAGENPGEEPGDDPVVDPETGVTYNVTVPVGTKACYIAGDMNSWSFTEMTKTDDTHYTVTLAEATDTMGYKYCSGPGWAYVELTEEGGEVANRTYAANDVVEAWKAVYDPANAPTPGEAKDITIKAKVPATWTETITAWVWATGEPGKAVTPTKDGEWYVYTEHCPELNIIFRNGVDWTTNANQTVDITVSESTCIEIIAGTDKATYTIVDCEDNPGEEPGDDPVVEPETGVTYNVTVPAGTKACYIAGEMNGWSHEEMTKVDETHYTITIATAITAMKYKYCSGPSWDYVEMLADGITDVQDRTYSANDIVEAWKAVYEPAGEDPTPGEPKDITVKAKVPAAWTEQITAWVWATGGEGQEVVPTQEGEWYVYTQNCAELNIIFKNGAGWNGDANQTVDITVTESTCIEITADGATKATYTVVDCEGGEDSELPTDTVDVYTIAGVTSLVGVNWDPTATINDMIKQEDGTYTLVKTDLQLVANMPYEYKVVKNHSWEIWSIPGWNMGNDTLLVDKSGIYDVTFSLNLVDTALTAVAQLKEELVLIPTVQLAGTMTDWAENAIEMTLSEDSLSASTTVTLLADSVYEFKIIVDGNWKGYDGIVTRDYSIDLVFNSGSNCSLITDVEGEYAFTWTFANNSVSVVYPENNFPKPEPKDITVKAKMPTTWNDVITAWVWPTGGDGRVVEPTQEGEWYVVTENCTELNIIFRNGSEWSTVDNQTVDMTFTESTCVQLAQEGGDMATYTVVDCEGGEVIDPAQITYVLMGVQGDWTTGIELTKNETAEWEEYMLLGQTISQGDSVKVVRLEAGVAKHWCGNVKEGVTVTITYDDNGNIILAPGTYDFYYDVAADAIWIAEAAQTAVDNVILENKATKIIRNGQMYIIREGVMYNALGQVAE